MVDQPDERLLSRRPDRSLADCLLLGGGVPPAGDPMGPATIPVKIIPRFRHVQYHQLLAIHRRVPPDLDRP